MWVRQILNNVEYKHDSIVITRAGKPSAAIIDMDLFEKIRQMKGRFNELVTELQESFSLIKEDDIELLINEARNKTRRK